LIEEGIVSSTYDAIVVGGGIVGASAAYHLVRAGAKTLLIDRHDAGRATDAGAGILAPEMSQQESDAWFGLAVEAVDYYPPLVAALQEENAGETSYARCGMLQVAATEDEIPAFEEAKRVVLARREQRGRPSADDLYPISPNEARELFPALGHVQGAIYSRQAARVDGRQMGKALRKAAENRGLHVIDGGVRSFTRQGSRVIGVEVDGQAIHAATTIIAGGAWSAQLGEQLGVRIPVEPQRGQIAHLELAGEKTGEWPVVGAFHGHYLVAWPDGRVAAGATRETGSGFEVTTTAAGIREVLDEALRVAPGLARAKLLEVRVGMRPYTRDRMPVLGEVPGIDGVLIATGHGSTGLQLGPLSGKLMAEMALGQTIGVDLKPFSVARF
jgi:D-amino-acid dehydrogenase